VKRGEIWVADLNPPRGREIGKVRPALIMQSDDFSAIGPPMVIILPLTTKVYPRFTTWRVSVPARSRLLKGCQVVVDQPRALDRKRFGEGPLAELAGAEMDSVERSLKAILGML